MLPSLLRLNGQALCQPCTPVDALLGKWSDRYENLSNEQLEQIPNNYNDARAECSICLRELWENAPRGGKEVIVAVDKVASCGHAFHKECLTEWFNEQEKHFGPLKCPLCLKPFVDATIDELYHRINGERKAEHQEGRRQARARIDRINEWNEWLEARELERQARERERQELIEMLEWPLTLDHDPGGWAVAELAPGGVRIKVPREHVANWKRYTYERFMEKYNVDTLTFDRWVELLAKSDERRSLWVRYYVILLELQQLKEGVLDSYDLTKAQAMELLGDVKDAREQGNTWKEILLALTLGRVPEGTPRRL